MEQRRRGWRRQRARSPMASVAQVVDWSSSGEALRGRDPQAPLAALAPTREVQTVLEDPSAA
jgi:hypothetical protein